MSNKEGDVQTVNSWGVSLGNANISEMVSIKGAERICSRSAKVDLSDKEKRKKWVRKRNEVKEYKADKIIALFKSGMKVSQIIESTGCCRSYVSQVLIKRGIVKAKNVGRKGKAVIQMTLQGEFVAEYESKTCAEISTGIDGTAIGKVCRGEFSQSGGYKWRYKEQE